MKRRGAYVQSTSTSSFRSQHAAGSRNHAADIRKQKADRDEKAYVQSASTSSSRALAKAIR
jgi:hypothetical protein